MARQVLMRNGPAEASRYVVVQHPVDEAHLVEAVESGHRSVSDEQVLSLRHLAGLDVVPHELPENVCNAIVLRLAGSAGSMFVVLLFCYQRRATNFICDAVIEAPRRQPEGSPLSAHCDSAFFRIQAFANSGQGSLVADLAEQHQGSRRGRFAFAVLITSPASQHAD